MYFFSPTSSASTRNSQMVAHLERAFILPECLNLVMIWYSRPPITLGRGLTCFAFTFSINIMPRKSDRLSSKPLLGWGWSGLGVGAYYSYGPGELSEEPVRSHQTFRNNCFHAAKNLAALSYGMMDASKSDGWVGWGGAGRRGNPRDEITEQYKWTKRFCSPADSDNLCVCKRPKCNLEPMLTCFISSDTST